MTAKASVSKRASDAARSAIVLVCDRLNPAFLGPYGNTWIETPALDRLAAQSLLVEQCLTCSPDLPIAYDSYWSCSEGEKGESLLKQFADRRITTSLLTDARELTSHPLADGFARHVCIPSSSDGSSAADVEDTEWATIMSAILSELDSTDQNSETGQLLWIHARGCDGLWDAPYEMRMAFSDEDDPDPPDFVEAPEHDLKGEIDPDFLLGIQQAYAAEMSVLDTCLGPLVERLSESDLANTLFVLTSPRGFPLGSHGVVGKSRPSLHVESLHLPLLVRYPGGDYQAERSQTLWQPADVCELLRRWMLDGEVGQSVVIDDLGGERAASCSGAYWSLRTPAWFATGIQPGESDDGVEELRLYAKPDDRFEANNVSDICEAIAVDMRAEYEQMVTRAKSGEEDPPLPDHLREPQE